MNFGSDHELEYVFFWRDEHTALFPRFAVGDDVDSGSDSTQGQ
jgi:hypothetical protein